MPKKDLHVIYWDSSAILSTIFKDRHSAAAKRWVHKESIHLMSTLAYTEPSLRAHSFILKILCLAELSQAILLSRQRASWLQMPINFLS